jgi:hypothetical protein
VALLPALNARFRAIQMRVAVSRCKVPGAENPGRDWFIQPHRT